MTTPKGQPADYAMDDPRDPFTGPYAGNPSKEVRIQYERHNHQPGLDWSAGLWFFFALVCLLGWLGVYAALGAL